MTKIFAPIQNLIIDNSIPSQNIYHSGYVTEKFELYFKQCIGTIQIDKFIEVPSFYFEINDPIPEPSVTLHNISANNNGVLGLGFWLVKDCACFSHVSFLNNTDNKSVTKDTRNVFYSKSNGRYESEYFSEFQVNDAFHKYSCLSEYLNKANEQENIITEGQIIGGLSSAEYNDFERINRAINFIQIARSTTLLPHKISNYIIALESLFGNSETNDLTFKLSYRIPLFFYTDRDEREAIHTAIKAGYDIRSRFLHGDKLKSKHTKEFMSNISTKIDDILRKTISILVEDEYHRNILLNSDNFKAFFHERLIG